MMLFSFCAAGKLKMDNLYEHHRVWIGQNDLGLTLEPLLGSRIPKFTKEKFFFYSTRGRILLNGQPVSNDYVAKRGDEFVLYSPYSMKAEIQPVPMELDIVYEDDAVIVVNKPAGLVMHPGLGNHNLSLLHGLAWHFQQNNSVVQVPNGLVHRIDKGTAGLVVVAKLGKAHKTLVKQFRKKIPERTYHALVHGRLERTEGTLKLFMGRHPENDKLITVSTDKSFGKFSVTHYKLLEEFPETSLVECKLGTGRTHQVRVHMHHIGNPLLNDKRYVLPQFDNEPYADLPGHTLIAKTLGFEHPYTKEFLQFEINYPLWFLDLIKLFQLQRQIPTNF